MTAKMRGLPPAPRVRAKVTKKIIATSVPADSGHCMLADAVAAAVPWARFVSADLQTIRFSDPARGLRYVYLTPRSAQQALIMFDQGQHPEPFSFELRAGQTTQRARQRETITQPDGSKKRIWVKTPGARTSPRFVAPQNDGAVPQIRGGPTPPMGTLAGGSVGAVPASHRRSFGLRSMDRLVTPDTARKVLAEQDQADRDE